MSGQARQAIFHRVMSRAVRLTCGSVECNSLKALRSSGGVDVRRCMPKLQTQMRSLYGMSCGCSIWRPVPCKVWPGSNMIEVTSSFPKRPDSCFGAPMPLPIRDSSSKTFGLIRSNSTLGYSRSDKDFVYNSNLVYMVHSGITVTKLCINIVLW